MRTRPMKAASSWRSTMQIPILIEQIAGNGYRARGGDPLALTGEGASQEEALANLKEKLQARLGHGTVAITVLSVEEQLSGWYAQLRQAKRPERLAWAYRRLSETVHFLARLEILIYEEKAMQRFEQLRKQKIRIGRTDLRIAATVLEH